MENTEKSSGPALIKVFVTGARRERISEIIRMFAKDSPHLCVLSCEESEPDCRENTAAQIFVPTCAESLAQIKIRSGKNYLFLDSSLRAGELLLEHRATVITCGFKTEDTLTFSALSEDFAAVSLRRSFSDAWDREVVPAEFPIAVDPENREEFAILAGVGVSLIAAVPLE